MNQNKKIQILDWAIIIFILFMIICIYIPKSIWKEENYFKDESRHRMKVISQAQGFYYELTGQYTMDGNKLFTIVESAIDSLIADSLFLGSQIIYIEDDSMMVDLEKGFELRADTTFSHAENMKKNITDTVYTISMKNPESFLNDTLYVNSKSLPNYVNDDLFNEIISTEIVQRKVIVTDYLRNKFHLIDPLLLCPLINEPYIFSIDSLDVETSIFTVSSPVPLDYSESRYGIFSFKSGNHGYIKDGVTSWADRE